MEFRDNIGQLIVFYDSDSLQTSNTDWSYNEVITPIAPQNAYYVRFLIYLEKPVQNCQSIINADYCSFEKYEHPPFLDINPKYLSFGAVNDTMVLTLENLGGGSVNWTFQTISQDWLDIDINTGTTSIETDFVNVFVDRTGLNLDQKYIDTLVVLPNAGEQIKIPIIITIPTDVPDSSSKVSVNGSQLIVRKRLPNGLLDFPKPFVITGFAWSPDSVETTEEYESRRRAFEGWSAYDLGMIKGCGANTIYMFLDFGLNSTIYNKILDDIYLNDLMAIITVDVDGYNDTTNLKNVVTAYKNHPAVLMWAIGNEWNINTHHDPLKTILQAAIDNEISAQLIKSLDMFHPVASIYGEINIPGQYPNTFDIVNTYCPSVDVWGLNIYRGDNFGGLFDEWDAITSKPFFLSEFGIDSYFTIDPVNPSVGYEDEQTQAVWNTGLWMELQYELSASIPSNKCLGGTFFEWNDEWWKVDPIAQQDPGGFYTYWNPQAFPDAFANEEYFGCVNIDYNIRIPKLVYYELSQLFKEFVYLDAKVYIEGPFNVTNMNTQLNPDFLPLNQPYNNPPWEYNGQESIMLMPNGDVVDWILVELRETTGDASTATSDSMIAIQAAFILNNGSIVGMDGFNPTLFNVKVSDNLYVIIHHRNHLPIMSAYPLTESNGIYTYDFTTSEDKAYGGSLAHKEIASGIWGMIAADGNADGEVDNKDKDDIWFNQNGNAGYYSGDFNMDSQVDDSDTEMMWQPNAGKGSQVPE